MGFLILPLEKSFLLQQGSQKYHGAQNIPEEQRKP